MPRLRQRGITIVLTFDVDGPPFDPLERPLPACGEVKLDGGAAWTELGHAVLCSSQVRLEASQVDYRHGAAVEVTSVTLGRELVFVLQHTIHHQAIVALLLAARGIAIPPRFG